MRINPLVKTLSLILLIIICASGLFYLGWWARGLEATNSLISPLAEKIDLVKNNPLERYTFVNLKNQQFSGSTIVLEDVLESQDQFTSYLFSFSTEGKKVTGQANIPNGTGPFPVIVLLRGWVDPAIYETGIGTKNAAAVFAQNGYLTLSPDFLGYGSSDQESTDVFEARFQKITTVLTLLASINSLTQADYQRIGIWGHSNGAQIALSVLEITGHPYPTTLWAPVSKPFPYNILYYTDEAEDHGKALRKSLAQFEKIYDVDQYSIHNYYDWITAPLIIHQGTADDAVPYNWSTALVDTLTDLKKDVTYFQYPGADHNLRPSWNLVVNRDLNFFRRYLQEKI